MWGRLLAPLICLGLWSSDGCSPPPRPAPAPSPGPEQWHEQVAPDGPWRPHLLKRCRGVDQMTPVAESALQACWELFQDREGSDAIMTLELFLEEHEPEGLVLLALGQLYLMGGQGEPELLPHEGVAADVGDWPRNKARLLGRAENLLRDAAAMRADDSAVEYLLSDVARARGDSMMAQRAFRTGLYKCTLSRSLELLRQYQDLHLRAARVTEPVEPDYPSRALGKGIQGEVVLDLLISPEGRILQVEPVSSPTASLTEAAATALRQATIDPAKVGKYPIWSWLRVSIWFRITE